MHIWDSPSVTSLQLIIWGPSGNMSSGHSFIGLAPWSIYEVLLKHTTYMTLAAVLGIELNVIEFS